MSSLTRKLRFLRASTTSPSTSTFSSTAMTPPCLQFLPSGGGRAVAGSHTLRDRGHRHGLAMADCAHRGGLGRQHHPVYEVAALRREILGVCGIAAGRALTSKWASPNLRPDAEPSRRERGPGVVRPAALKPQKPLRADA